MNVQKKADNMQHSRSMGTVARVLKLECSGWVKSLTESTSTDDGERGKGEGAHTVDRLASL